MKHQNFVYKIRSHYIILHTHTHTNKLKQNSYFQRKKNPKVLFSFRYTYEVNSSQVLVEISISNLVKSKT